METGAARKKEANSRGRREGGRGLGAAIVPVLAGFSREVSRHPWGCPPAPSSLCVSSSSLLSHRSPAIIGMPQLRLCWDVPSHRQPCGRWCPQRGPGLLGLVLSSGLKAKAPAPLVLALSLWVCCVKPPHGFAFLPPVPILRSSSKAPRLGRTRPSHIELLGRGEQPRRGASGFPAARRTK